MHARTLWIAAMTVRSLAGITTGVMATHPWERSSALGLGVLAAVDIPEHLNRRPSDKTNRHDVETAWGAALVEAAEQLVDMTWGAGPPERATGGAPGAPEPAALPHAATPASTSAPSAAATTFGVRQRETIDESYSAPRREVPAATEPRYASTGVPGP
jgi:hypothetical protein